jgi:preprotein translocase subunit SecD
MLQRSNNMVQRNTPDTCDQTRLYLVARRAEVAAETIADARVQRGEGAPSVELTFDPRGAAAFEALTTRIVGHLLAIVLDGAVLAAPLVMSPIRGGKAIVTLGAVAPDELARQAETLAAALRGGALPSPLTLVSERKLAAP